MGLRTNIIVTIGLCVKNEEKKIIDTIESICNQDFPQDSIELIVVDGYSRDKTFTYIKDTLKKSDLITKIFKENQGLAAARQIVVDNAQGKYIAWVDSGVTLSRDYIRKNVDFMEQRPDVGIVKGKFKQLSTENLVGFLENIAFVESFHDCANTRILSLPGTEGAVYRTQAIRNVQGFDPRMRGAGEDLDAAYRIRTAGWSIYITDTTFHEEVENTWRALWHQYFWYGYGGHYLHHKDRRINPVFEMLPITGFFVGFLRSSGAYNLTYQKRVFLLPIHYLVKRFAWIFGFLSGHLHGYGHLKMPSS